MVPTQKAFETIAIAKVSMSAHEAIDLGYLRKSDRIVLSREYLIAEAKCEVLVLAEDHVAPEPAVLIPPGEGGRLARVLTGGEHADGIQPVDEQYLLDLERETFVGLAAEEKSQARMAHMLKTGKPLRN